MHIDNYDERTGFGFLQNCLDVDLQSVNLKSKIEMEAVFVAVGFTCFYNLIDLIAVLNMCQHSLNYGELRLALQVFSKPFSRTLFPNNVSIHVLGTVLQRPCDQIK